MGGDDLIGKTVTLDYLADGGQAALSKNILLAWSKYRIIRQVRGMFASTILQLVATRGNTTISTEGTMTDRHGFYGVRCPHPGVDYLLNQILLLLMHYGCNTAVGKMMRTSMELLIMELGMTDQPFKADFRKYGGMKTVSSLKVKEHMGKGAPSWDSDHRITGQAYTSMGE